MKHDNYKMTKTVKPEELLRAARRGQYNETKRLINEGGNINCVNEEGRSPLHLASYKGHFKTVTVLARFGAEINKIDNEGNTPLHLAAMGHKPTVVRLLLDLGADPSIENAFGKLPTNVAYDYEVRKILDGIIEGGEACLVNPILNSDGRTLLHDAVNRGKIGIVKTLVKNGADINCHDNEGNTPLHEAVLSNNRSLKLISVLVERNAYINAQNDKGHTALHLSCRVGAENLISLLLEYSADPAILDINGQPAEAVARTKKALKILKRAAERNVRKKQKVIGGYLLGEVLGAGAFSKVRSAVSMNDNTGYAVKQISKSILDDEESFVRLMKEISILKILKHPNIIQLIDIFETTKNIYIIMERAKGGELFDFIIERERVREDIAKIIFCQIVSGVEFCHKLNIVHRDLKPENIIVSEKGEVKIIDFGLSNIKIDANYSTSCGSPHYVAPEILQGLEYGPEVDMWSLGIVLYAMLYGQLPFDEAEEVSIIREIVSLDDHLVFPEDASVEVESLIRMMLVKDGENRPTFAEIRSHPWVDMPPFPRPRAPPDLRILDENILDTMQKLQFKIEDVIESVSNQIDDVYYRVYCILYENEQGKRRTIERIETEIFYGRDPLSHFIRESERKAKFRAITQYAGAISEEELSHSKVSSPRPFSDLHRSFQSRIMGKGITERDRDRIRDDEKELERLGGPKDWVSELDRRRSSKYSTPELDGKLLPHIENMKETAKRLVESSSDADMEKRIRRNKLLEKKGSGSDSSMASDEVVSLREMLRIMEEKGRVKKQFSVISSEFNSL